MVPSTTPFPHWVIDDWCDPIHLSVINSVPWEASYDNDIEHGKQTARDRETLPKSITSLMDRLTSCVEVHRWSRETGLDLVSDPTNHGGGLHCMRGGGWLQGHLDYAAHPRMWGLERRMNVIAFIHPEWKWEWGGQLLLMDPNGKTIAEIDPKPGRLVAFETGDNSYHGVRVVSKSRGPRVSIAAYYLAPIRLGVTRSRAMFFPNRSQGGTCPVEVM